MKITALEVFRYRLPLTQPLLFNHHRIERRVGFVVKLTDQQGHRGWGEVAPLEGFSRETLEGCRKELDKARRILSTTEIPDDWVPLKEELPQEVSLAGSAPSVRFGLETALWNLWRRAGRDLLFSGTPTVPLNALLMGSPDQVLKEARDLVRAGYKSVKLKVGRRPVADEARLTLQIREAVGKEIGLRLDANRAWNLEEAIRFGQAIEGAEIDYIEEPLADPREIPLFIRKSTLPIALDESLQDLPADSPLAPGVRALVLKPSFLGGIERCLKFAAAAKESGARAVVSAAFESGVGIAALARLAVVISGETPVGLDTYRWLARDVLAPRITIRGGTIDLESLQQCQVNQEQLEEQGLG